MGNYLTTITLAGATGSATTKPIHGHIETIAVNYTGVGATTVIAFVRSLIGVSETIYTTAATNTDFVTHLEIASVKADNTASGQFVKPFLSGEKLTLSVTDSSAGSIQVLITTS